MEGKKSIGKTLVGMIPGFIAVIAGTTVALIIYGKFLKSKMESGSAAPASKIVVSAKPDKTKKSEQANCSEE
jgi:hypothetical protein